MVDELAARIGLVPPSRWWRGRTEGPGSGRTTLILLYALYALLDGWSVCVSCDGTYQDADELANRLREMAKKAGIEDPYRPGLIEALAQPDAVAQMAAGRFNGPDRVALFEDHFRPGAMSSTAESGALLDEHDPFVRAMRADQARDAAPKGPHHRASRRARMPTERTRHVRHPGGHEETIHEQLVSDELDHEERWVRVAPEGANRC